MSTMARHKVNDGALRAIIHPRIAHRASHIACECIHGGIADDDDACGGGDDDDDACGDDETIEDDGGAPRGRGRRRRGGGSRHANGG